MTDLEAIRAPIQRLCSLEKLDPPHVADLLERRLRLAGENERQVVYELCGQAATPWSRVELRWGMRRPGGFLLMEVDRTLSVSTEEILPLWKDFPMSIVPEDFGSSRPATLYVYKVPVGELRFVFEEIDGRSILTAVAVDESTLVAWPR